jgi:hypothetical protein
MLDGILHVILKPVDFFRKLLDDDKVASRAFGVVLIVMVLAGVYGYFVALPTADAIANTPFGAFGLITTPVSFVVISLLSWLIFGLLVRMAAGISIKPWAITGYSLSPQIIIYALLIILAVLFPVKLSPVTVDPTKEPEAFQEAMISLQQESQQTVFGRASQILSYLSSLWWIVLIFLGVREATDTRKAVISALVVGIPTVLLSLLPFLLSPVT